MRGRGFNNPQLKPHWLQTFCSAGLAALSCCLASQRRFKCKGDFICDWLLMAPDHHLLLYNYTNQSYSHRLHLSYPYPGRTWLRSVHLLVSPRFSALKIFFLIVPSIRAKLRIGWGDWLVKQWLFMLIDQNDGGAATVSLWQIGDAWTWVAFKFVLRTVR